MKTSLATLCVTLVAIISTAASASTWVGTWGAAPLPTMTAAGPRPNTPVFSNQTIRQVVRISVGGNRVRVRLTNEYGSKPLAIGAARIALAGIDGAARPGMERPLTFDGKTNTVIPTGAPMLSDPVELPVEALSLLTVSLFFPEDTGPCTCHTIGMQTAYVSETGDFTKGAFTPKEKILARAFLSGVEVETTVPAKAIAILGDSISDGYGSTNDANRRWPDLLASRLAARAPTHGWGVVNMGLSGNRLLNDGSGQSALARFDRDILSVPGLGYIIVFLGVNDLGVAYGQFDREPVAALKSRRDPIEPTAASMIAAYRQLIMRAHAKGVKIYGATIAPYEGSGYYSTEGNSVREAINRWIRTSGEFDAVLDFDAVLRDPAKPTQLAMRFHAGDHLHGSDAGYQAIAESIDLSLFE